MMNLEKEIRQQPEVLSKLYLNNQTVIADIVKAAKKRGIIGIYFAARGTSDHACTYAQYLFGILTGLPCVLGTPSVFTKYNASIHLQNYLVIGVSQSGKAEDVLSILKDANEQGALTVAVTNNPESPMAKEACYHLDCYAGEEISIAATKTFTAQLGLLACLCAVYANHKDFLAQFHKIPDLIKKTIESAIVQIDALIADYADKDGGVILARGVMYPIALEAALKILETNQKKMRGYPISDFYHGPIAQLFPNDYAIVLAQKGVMFTDAEAMIQKLLGIGVKVIVVTDNKDFAESDSLTVIRVPDAENELLSPFVFAVTLQLFAQRMVQYRGIDPDVSKVLNKITITK